jgi:hypothetical protein
VQPFYRRTEEGRRGWERADQGRCGRDKAAERAPRRRRIVARPSGIDGCMARVSWQGRDTGRDKSPTAGPVNGRLVQLTGARMPCRMAVLLCRPE